MKEFTRTSVMEPAKFSFRGLDLNRFLVYLWTSSLAAKALDIREQTHTA